LKKKKDIRKGDRNESLFNDDHHPVAWDEGKKNTVGVSGDKRPPRLTRLRKLTTTRNRQPDRGGGCEPSGNGFSSAIPKRVRAKCKKGNRASGPGLAQVTGIPKTTKSSFGSA